VTVENPVGKRRCGCMGLPALFISRGIEIECSGSRVTVTFVSEVEADLFVEWMKALDSVESPREMMLIPMPSKPKD
jgi:hypothetical protein